MARAGARLVEVGTTNRTHLKDYERRVGDGTGLILKAHTSNYLIQGFTKSVSAPELSALARARKVPFVHDLGSGALVDLARYGLRARADGAGVAGRRRRPRHLLRRQAAGRAAGRHRRRPQGPGGARGQEPHEARAAPRQDPAGGAGSHPQALPRSRPAGRDAADDALLRAPEGRDGARPRRACASRSRPRSATPTASTSPTAPARSAPARCRWRRCRAPASPSRPWTARARAAGSRRWSRRCAACRSRCWVTSRTAR